MLSETKPGRERWRWREGAAEADKAKTSELSRK
jgi:hypothetical protein